MSTEKVTSTKNRAVMGNSSGIKFLVEKISGMKFLVEIAKWNQKTKSAMQTANENWNSNFNKN